MSDTLSVEVTTNLSSFISQRRFPTNLKITELKDKLEMITGASHDSMELHLLDENNETISKLLEDKQLSAYPLEKAKTLHVIDNSKKVSEFEDVSKVQKYEMSKDSYEKRDDTFKAFKQKLKVGQDSEAEQKKLLAEEEIANHIKIGQRCEVRTKGNPCRRGTVKFVGKTHFKPGFWVGVRYDEPLGKNDGSHDGMRYFECEQKYGGFVRPADVIVGDFKEEGLEELDEI